MMMKVASDPNGRVTWNTYLDQYDRPGGDDEDDENEDADEDILTNLQKESFERVAAFGQGSTKEIDGDTLISFFKAIGIPAEEEEVEELMKLAAKAKTTLTFKIIC